LLLLIYFSRLKNSPLGLSGGSDRFRSCSLLSRHILVDLFDSLLYAPIENVIVLEPFSNEQIPEQLPQVRVVGFVVESQRTAVIEVDGEFVGESSTEVFGRSRHLLLHDSVVLLLLGSGLESLPRERSSKEVHQDVTERFHIVTTRLFCEEWHKKSVSSESTESGRAKLTDTQMSVDRSVTSGTGQVLVLTVRNVKVSLWVSVLLRQTEIDHVDLVPTLADAHEEVVGFDIAMDEVS